MIAHARSSLAKKFLVEINLFESTFTQLNFRPTGTGQQGYAERASRLSRSGEIPWKAYVPSISEKPVAYKSRNTLRWPAGPPGPLRRPLLAAPVLPLLRREAAPLPLTQRSAFGLRRKRGREGRATLFTWLT